MCVQYSFAKRCIHTHTLHTQAFTQTRTLANTVEAVEQGITINSLKWLGSIYKHVAMLFTVSDWMDYISTQASEGNTLDIHTVYTGKEKEKGGGGNTLLHKVPEWHVLQSEINIQ